MLTSNNKLEIFDFFKIDESLKKNQKLEFINGNFEIITVDSNKRSIFLSSADEGWDAPMNDGVLYATNIKKENFFSFIKKITIKKRKPTNKRKKYINLITFFSDITNNINTLVDLSDSIIHYENLIKQAIELNQTALKETLEGKLQTIGYEILLFNNGIKKFITEEQLVNFYLKTDKDKNLKLTWIKNYLRLIPNDVFNLKKSADKIGVFDNYVVLHYDPDNIATDMTEKEKEIAKDPILFGVFKNSNRLYFIADWKDDYCDLTLEDIINTLGEKVYDINNKSIISYIDNKPLKPKKLKSSK